MKTIHCSAFLIALSSAAFTAPTLAADVGLSVSINQPGFYGRIDINQPPPPAALVYPQPVIVAPPPVALVQPPIYLRVPPGHEKHWSKHCAQYDACGRPVYFIHENYYQEHYVVHEAPHMVGGQPVMVVRERGDGDEGHEHGRGHGRGHGRDDD